MAKVSLKQEVKIFKDEDFTGIQAVTLETDPEQDFWLSLEHNGESFTLSMDNWEKLTQLVNNAKKILKIDK